MRRLWIYAAVAPLFAAGCSRGGVNIEAKSEPPAPVVPVARVASADLARQTEITAEFRPFQEIDVHAKVAGYLKKIYVDVGDRVQQGQLLAVLEIPEMADDLTRAKAATQLSSANVERAREELQRAKSSHELAHLSYTRLAAVLKARPNLVAQQEIDSALARDRESESQVSAAQAGLSAAEHQVSVSQADQQKTLTLGEYARITAPFAGVITNRYADTGAMIQAGTASQTQALPVVRLSQNDLLRLSLPVPESAVPRIHLGDPVEVRVPTLNRTFAGKIARSSGKVSTSTRTMETEVDVPNSHLVLMPGMYAEVTITLERRPRALAVPVEAIADQETNPTVMLVDAEGNLEIREVKLGLETARRIEVLSGVSEGDLVFTGNRSQFRPGQKVRPKVVGE
jgi:RND family efflux transporter MFP subunit